MSGPQVQTRPATRPASVLYDAPGPRAVRRARVLSVVALVVFAVLAALAARRLWQQGEFEAELWSPLFWPGDEQFIAVWRRLLLGLSTTLRAAGLTILFSLVLGALVTVIRLLSGRLARTPLVIVLELLRGAPVVILIFFTDSLLRTNGISPPLLWSLVIGLTLYNFVVIGEIIRAGVAAVPRGQVEAGLATGLTRRQVMAIVQLPQAFRIMLPALISQLVVIVKDTSLAALVLTGPQELLRTGRTIEQNLNNPLQTYLLIAILYITLNGLLSRLAVTVENRLGRARGAGRVTAPPE